MTSDFGPSLLTPSSASPFTLGTKKREEGEEASPLTKKGKYFGIFNLISGEMLWFTQVELPAPEPPGQPGKPHHQVTFNALEFALGKHVG